jgi:hypothetical protein
VDFLEIYGEARETAIYAINIKKAWAKAGSEPFDPKVVLWLLPKEPSVDRPVTPQSSVTFAIGPTGERMEVPIMPPNTKQANELVGRLIKREKLDPSTHTELEKAS